MKNYFYKSLMESSPLYELWERSESAKQAIVRAQTLSKKNFIDVIRPCDILVTKLDAASVEGLTKRERIRNKAMSRLNSLVQGVPITSSKCILHNDNVSGFGVDHRHPTKISTMPVSKFLKNQKMAIICRHPGLEDSEETKILKYFREKKNLDYNKSSILKQLWKKIRKGEVKSLKDIDLKKFKPHEIEMWKDALFCSSFIAMAYKYGGIASDFTRNPLSIWPKDFLVSSSLDVIGKYVK